MSDMNRLPIMELEAVLARYDHGIDEPETIPFLAKVREAGIVNEAEWLQILDWLDEAMRFLGRPKPPVTEPLVIDPDEDPRNANWLRTISAQRLAGHRMPLWASLWLWRIGWDREKGPFWKQVGSVAETMAFPKFETR